MSLYFTNREDAGNQLAEILYHAYARSDAIILAFGLGGLMVSIPIARRLQLPVYMMASKDIDLPGGFDERVGAVNQSGDFVYGSNLTQGQIDEYTAEFHNYIDQQKTNAMHELNKMVGSSGYVSRELIKNRIVLLVSDGFKSAVDMDVVSAFIKPLSIKRLVAISPIASLDAIDALHIKTDEIRILSPKENYIETNHYYDDNNLPDDSAAEQLIMQLNNSVIAG